MAASQGIFAGLAAFAGFAPLAGPQLAASEYDFMKKSKDWVRQEDLDKKLEALVEHLGEILESMTICEVAQRLGVEANGEFYRKFRDWKLRQEGVAQAPAIGMPSDAKAQLRSALDRMADQVMDIAGATILRVGGDYARTAELRVIDAERRVAAAEAREEYLLGKWTETETKLDFALERADLAEAEVGKLTREIDWLYGRLEERGAVREELRRERVSEGTPAEMTGRPQAARVEPAALDRGIPRNEATSGPGASSSLLGTRREAPTAEPNPRGPRGPEQPSTNEADGQQVRQAELSLVEKVNAEKAEANNDENG